MSRMRQPVLQNATYASCLALGGSLCVFRLVPLPSCCLPSFVPLSACLVPSVPACPVSASPGASTFATLVWFCQPFLIGFKQCLGVNPNDRDTLRINSIYVEKPKQQLQPGFRSLFHPLWCRLRKRDVSCRTRYPPCVPRWMQHLQFYHWAPTANATPEQRL